MLEIRSLGLPEIREIVPRRFSDERGFFCEVFNAQRFTEHGLPTDWVQDNHSLSRPALTLRGLHYQELPFSQAKLVRVLAGRIFDVAVDIRQGSPTFGQWAAAELSAERFNQLLVPEGFAHGFLTLEPDTQVLYKVNAHYSAAHDRSIRWDDPALAIDWPIPSGGAPVLSDKDRAAPMLADAAPTFRFRPDLDA